MILLVMLKQRTAPNHRAITGSQQGSSGSGITIASMELC